MYKPMIDAFKTMDFLVLIPLFIGVVVCLFSLSALVDMLLRKIYADLFHFVVGIVIASTFMIVPLNYNYLSIGALVCIVAMIAGATLGFWMNKLEEKYKV
jgi:putative membrane protein